MEVGPSPIGPLAMVTNYFVRDSYSFRIGEMQLRAYHHTFQDVVEALFQTGFVVERLLEPVPSKRSEGQNPKAFATSRRYPSFCVIQARAV